ncbi:NAD(P)/FAD-dependent oxidoreductase [Dehalobacterium formicoaceticum]|uniref:NAD(P)/FAD-dependent oxidoreductase n=1 Tax=Dehalobacterium formicoaceticum TaxID=51515 RepID=A0ABT1Y4Q5_9FIRM|nr:NAD(P)/FAD-dependent oxidoreductase [Dehalobacterium formicoaceticum]MCR6545857.1 NAD(P)/FAD-dependent oxidoreductase [Dehalobacterium formicoaceticum]
MHKIVVIGGGAAGILAAIAAQERGARVTLLEKNKQIGKKMLITGKGRCNITNAGTREDIIENIPGNGTFLYSALNQFSNFDVIDFFRRIGVATKVERGDRVFPVSDRAQDVVEALKRYLLKLGVEIKYEQVGAELVINQGKVLGVRVKGDRFFPGDRVIVATGGSSYPGTGSTGDGYRMAASIGHQITPLKPSLVPLETREPWVKELQGLSLKNVRAAVVSGGKIIASDFGEMLFTHFGLSGPIILSLSNVVAAALKSDAKQPITVVIDLKPALSIEQLDQRIQRDFQKFARKILANALGDLLPKSLIPVFLKNLSVSQEKFVHQITKEEREEIVHLLKHFTVTITKTRPLAEAIVTAGGVHVKEVNPKTMESKIVEGLYFAGEVLDIDGYTGGYNLQAAFSTGWVAGSSAAE